MEDDLFYHLSDKDLIYVLESYIEVRNTLSGTFINKEEALWDKHIKLIDEELDRRLSETKGE